MTDPRYPIGAFVWHGPMSAAARADAIRSMAELPEALAAAVRGLDDAQLDTRYRAGGWTLRQVVHHVADSHVNSYVRHKLTATEANPPIKAYDEAAWAELADARGPIASSLLLVQAVHDRLVRFLESLAPEQFARPCHHSEAGPMTLDRLVALYAWHGEHHVAHITTLREAEGW